MRRWRGEACGWGRAQLGWAVEVLDSAMLYRGAGELVVRLQYYTQSDQR